MTDTIDAIKNVKEQQYQQYIMKTLDHVIELELKNTLLREQAERTHKLMRQMATLLRRVADEGDLIGEECQKFLDDFAAEIPF